MSVHLFGIRHHGIGSARSLIAALEALQPDCILIEGPPEADSLIPLVANQEMQPPVAMLVYSADEPQKAAWYPFAVYSPEWQAMRYGLAQGVNVQFMDLPQKYRLVSVETTQEIAVDHEAPQTAIPEEGEAIPEPEAPDIYLDPIGALAAIAGESDGESWWGRVVEEADNPIEIFSAIHEAMTTLREEPSSKRDEVEQHKENLREAWMRTTIRDAEKKYERIAVVCGAWHTPALVDLKSTKTSDKTLLKGLPSVKTLATFTPWTYSRLSLSSGYGAGIVSPGWYHHLWDTPAGEIPARWLARVAALLREEGLLASTAQVIDGLRLSQMLAGMRGQNVGLDELNDASVAVLCGGRVEPMKLIFQKLIVSDRIGSVPKETPTLPIQRDFTEQQKKLRLKLTQLPTDLDLDLREPNGLARSQLFHRLQLLNIDWATPTHAMTSSKGTFHEYWQIAWRPELDISLIEASIWGSTIESAALAFVQNVVAETNQLKALTPLLSHTMLSDLPAAVSAIVQRLSNLANVTHDVAQLMDAAPPLVETLRYGDVRKTDSNLIMPVLKSMIVRSCIGLYGASLNLDTDAAQDLYERILKLNSALQLVQDESLLTEWHQAIHGLVKNDAPHPLISGLATRILFRAEQLSMPDVEAGMRRAFSVGHDPLYGANWLEGFLTGMEHVLLHDPQLFKLVDEWLTSNSPEQFVDILPLLRRTFSTFDAPARRNLSEHIQHGKPQIKTEAINEGRAARVMPLLKQILGVS